MALTQDEIDNLLDTAEQYESSSISIKIDKTRNRFTVYNHKKEGYMSVNTSPDRFYDCYDEYLDKIGYIDSEYDPENYEKSEEYKPINEIYSQVADLESQINKLNVQFIELHRIKSQQDIKVKQGFLDKFKEMYPEYIV